LCPNMRYYTSVSLDGLGRTTKNRKRVGVIIKIISGNLVDRIVKIYQLGPSCWVKYRRRKIGGMGNDTMTN
jgi:hypothetical protein